MTKPSQRITNLAKEACFGCASCHKVCAKEALVMRADAEGFLYPFIDSTLCVECGACAFVCPSLSDGADLHEPLAYYAAAYNDRSVHEKSSSGGVFVALAKEVLLQGGVVVGAAFEQKSGDGPLFTAHRCIDSEKELHLLQGSKYSQSRLDTVLQGLVRLAYEKPMLFSGTPCQVGAVKRLVGKAAARLYCVDLVCYGVASPSCFAKYLASLGSVTDFSFRERVQDKGNRFISYTIDGKKTVQAHGMSPFMRAFFANMCMRPSCHVCPYAKAQRVGDITLADLHNTRRPATGFEGGQGASAVSVNTAMGLELWQRVQNSCISHPMTKEDSSQPRLEAPTKASDKRNAFMADFAHLSFSELVQKYVPPTDAKQRLLAQLRARHGK